MTMTARDIMQTSVLSIAPTTPLQAVQRMFFEEEIHGAPVVDETGAVLGIVTSMDLVRSSAEEDDDARLPPVTIDYLADLLEYSASDLPEAAGRLEASFGDRVAADVMTEDPVTVDVATPVSQVAQVLTQNHIHRVLVVDGDELCGIVSSSDLVALLAKGA